MEKYFKQILDHAISTTSISEKGLLSFENSNEHLLYKEALDFLCDADMLKKISRYRYEITTNGRNIHRDIGIDEHISQIKEKQKQIELKEQIDFEKSKIDLELAKRMLKEFPKTKLISRISLFIGIGLAILKLVEWIMQLQSQ